jgi:hypothetical protein
MAGTVYYHPSDEGYEKNIKERRRYMGRKEE